MQLILIGVQSKILFLFGETIDEYTQNNNRLFFHIGYDA